MKHSYLDYANVRKALNLLRACNNRIRQQFLEILMEYDELSLNDLARYSKHDLGAAKSHLAIMLRAEVVLNKTNGKEIVYYLNEDKLRQIKRALSNYFVPVEKVS